MTLQKRNRPFPTATQQPDRDKAPGEPARLTLRQLNLMVRDAIEMHLPDEYWVEAELSECRERGGHCYMELIEKDARSNTPVARASAKCWRQTWQIVAPYFERTTGQPLHAGMKVLLKVYAQYHEAYGFSWIVTDIDPAYTLGDMARRRQEIVRQLKEEGVFDMQQELRLSPFTQHIAVVSAQNAAGYGDFCRQLADNDYGLRFSVTLFPAVMQGEQVEQSIIAALNAIFAAHTAATTPAGPSAPSSGLSPLSSAPSALSAGPSPLSSAPSALSAGPSALSAAPSASHRPEVPYAAALPQPFDAVVIIRGGGATADLSGFDTLALAENVAQFPLPVITGIGHDRDESILDMVAHTHVKTPTAAATFLIDHLAQTLRRIEDAQNRMTLAVSSRIAAQQARIAAVAALIPTLARRRLADGHHRMELQQNRMDSALERHLTAHRHRIEQLALTLQGYDPQVLLARGYSITLKDGRAVRNAVELQPGDIVETRVEHGSFRAIVKSS